MDDADKWLQANDPLASGQSSRGYARAIGTISSHAERDIRQAEQPRAVDDKASEWHCSACYRKEYVARHTVL